ncbi:MAG: hypothetical protein ABL874_07340 [Sphingopyxis sp.]
MTMLAARITHAPTQAWVELRFAKAPLTFADIYFAVRGRAPSITSPTLWTHLRAWMRGGFVRASGHPVHYAMADNARAMAGPPAITRVRKTRHWTERRTARQRLWSAMRVLKRFDLVQLRLAADVSEPRAKDFLRIMTRAGYLRSDIGVGQIIPTWARGTRGWGPLAPSSFRLIVEGRPVMRVTDHNDGAVIDLPLRAHRAAAPFFKTED